MKIIGEGGHARVIKSFLQWSPERQGTIIAIGDNRDRKKEAESRPGEFFPVLYHPSVCVNRPFSVGEGTVVMAGAIIQPGVKIGRHCIINTGATIDHDCVLDDYVHIAPGAHLCGSVRVGEGTLVGVGVGIGPNTILPSWSIVKAKRLEIEPI